MRIDAILICFDGFDAIQSVCINSKQMFCYDLILVNLDQLFHKVWTVSNRVVLITTRSKALAVNNAIAVHFGTLKINPCRELIGKIVDVYFVIKNNSQLFFNNARICWNRWYF